jgi:hypothetical protein
MSFSRSNPSFNPPPRQLDEAVAAFLRGWQVIPLHAPVGNGVCSCGRHRCHSPGKASTLHWLAREGLPRPIEGGARLARYGSRAEIVDT